LVLKNTNIPRAFSGLLIEHEKNYTFKERPTFTHEGFYALCCGKMLALFLIYLQPRSQGPGNEFDLPLGLEQD